MYIKIILYIFMDSPLFHPLFSGQNPKFNFMIIFVSLKKLKPNKAETFIKGIELLSFISKFILKF